MSTIKIPHHLMLADPQLSGQIR